MLPLFLALACSTPELSPPNLLLITLDTTRADALSCYGGPFAHTPALDRLAEEGVRFTRAYTVTPLTIPAHSSLFTGLWPPRHGVRDNGDTFLGEEPHTLAERLHEAGYATAASVGAEVTSRHWGFGQGFETYFDDMGEAREEESNRWRVERPGDAVVADALEWLDRPPEDARPWFLWVHLFDPHHPYAAPEAWAAQHPRRPYQAEVAWTDHLVEVLLSDLEERGELDRTWVVAVGDHGEGLGSHGEGMHGTLLYDATTHVPLLVRPPGGRAPATVDFPVSLVDLSPTLLAAAGLAPPQDGDGLSLLPWLQGAPPALEDRAVYVESQYAWRHYGWAPQSGLVTSEHKLISSTTPELYARGDRGERADLAGSQPELLASLQTRLDELVAAMEPQGSAGPATQSAEAIALLEQLGYVTTTATPTTTEGLPDPVAQLPLLRGLERARSALQSGDLASAREQLEAVLSKDPGLVEAQSQLARVLAQQGEQAEALALVEALYAQHPTASHGSLLASLLAGAGQPERALEVLEAALAEDPTLAPARMIWLHTLYGKADPRFAQEAELAATLLPHEPGVQGMLGLARLQQGDATEAERLLRGALDQAPSLPYLRHGLGVVLAQRGEADEAEALWLEEIRSHPPAVPTRRLLVATYAEQRRFEEQIAQLQALMALPHTHLEEHSLAQALFNLQRFEEARVHVEACREMVPSDPGCAMLQANVLKKLGDEEGALAAYHEALQLAEEHPPITGPFEKSD